MNDRVVVEACERKDRGKTYYGVKILLSTWHLDANVAKKAAIKLMKQNSAFPAISHFEDTGATLLVWFHRRSERCKLPHVTLANHLTSFSLGVKHSREEAAVQREAQFAHSSPHRSKTRRINQQNSLAASNQKRMTKRSAGRLSAT